MDVKQWDDKFGTKKDPMLKFTYKVACPGDEAAQHVALAATANMMPAKMLRIKDIEKLDSKYTQSVLRAWHVKIIQYLKMLKMGLEIAMMLQAAQNWLKLHIQVQDAISPCQVI
ncbi:hypothetical protein GGF31_001180 [Allomyces arbusculus]|nr:hypothetical protein GGF31_001180 [Allomyces arbusculus]